MKNKKNPNHSSFRCDFNAENANDKIIMEKILHLRSITQFNNKQLLNFLLCLGDETIGSCQTFSDFLGMFTIGQKTQPSEAQPRKPEDLTVESTELPQPASENTVTTSASSPSDTILDDLFQSDDDPETEKMIADMLNL